MSKVFMAIGAHIGDAELTAGLVLASEALKGNKIITVALTAGERGNPPSLTVKEYRKQKVSEAKEFANLLNGEAIVLDHVDGELPDDKNIRLEVANIIRKYQPTMIFTHWVNSMHVDHKKCAQIVLDASFYAGIDMEDKLEGKRHFAPVYFSENWEDMDDFKPYMYIDCSEDGYNLWTQAMKKHWFIMNSPSFKYYDYYTHLSQVRGALARTKYAQAFGVFEYQKKVVRKL
ncbi:MAG TPA: PIG-L family deacetylase [Acholeplasmataceae bacterium]|nr:PIG-L family deacetylase [Acholeplasmataceae bacterium]